jgi:hypothetical protein
MTKPDRLKEEIGWLKVLCGLGVAFETSLIAWLVQNYAVASRSLAVVAVCCVLVAVVGIVLLVVRLYRCLKTLEVL